MTENESTHLLALVTDSYGDDAASHYQLRGNGDYVVKVHRTLDECWWLWDFKDWRAYRRAEKAARKRQVCA